MQPQYSPQTRYVLVGAGIILAATIVAIAILLQTSTSKDGSSARDGEQQPEADAAEVRVYAEVTVLDASAFEGEVVTVLDPVGDVIAEAGDTRPVGLTKAYQVELFSEPTTSTRVDLVLGQCRYPLNIEDLDSRLTLPPEQTGEAEPLPYAHFTASFAVGADGECVTYGSSG